MPRASTKALAQVIAGDRADSSQLDEFLDNELDANGRSPMWFIEAALETVVAGDTTIAPTNTASIETMAMLFGDRELTEAKRESLDLLNPDWRTEPGTPHAFVRDEGSSKTVRMYPSPEADSDGMIPTFFLPLGRDYPEGNAVMFYSYRIPQAPEWADLFFALRILARDFKTESTHKDLDFSQSCEGLATIVAGAFS